MGPPGLIGIVKAKGHAGSNSGLLGPGTYGHALA